MVKVLTYNIHVGIEVSSPKNYALNLWKHIAPSEGKLHAIQKIAHALNPYGIVALQEIDLGSNRTHYINQAHFIADMAGFSHVVCRRNRNVKVFAQHGMALLSRYPILSWHDYSLPGSIPGRGLLFCTIKTPDGLIDVVSTHLSLSSKDRFKQFQFIKLLVSNSPRYLIMGDLNCGSEEFNDFFPRGISHSELNNHLPTHPSWSPKNQLDHIIPSSNISIINYQSVPFLGSDHLPVEMIIN